MNNPLYVIICICGAFCLLIASLFIWESVQLKRRIRREWGQLPTYQRKDHEESLQSACEVLQNIFPTKAAIDENTWYDLDLWTVFEQLNATKSSVGSEYLYYCLRSYDFDEKTIDELAEWGKYYEQHPEKREKVQYYLAKIGKLDKNFVWNYLVDPTQYQFQWSFIYLFLAVLPVIFLVLTPFLKGSAWLLLLLTIVVNLILSMLLKMRMDKELQSMGYLINGITNAKKVAAFAGPKQEELTQAYQKVAVLQHLGAAFRLNTGNDSDIFLQYLHMIFLLPINSYHFVLRRLQKESNAARQLWLLLGKIDTAIALLNFQKIMPYTCRPTFTEEEAVHATAMYHPLLTNPVANPVDWTRLTLVTGSNASGKSTYVKSVAINCLLAQTLGISCSETLRLPHSYIYSSMALEDNIFQGDSYFVAEIKSLKRILVAAQSEERVLCFIDEILKGTNTVERIAASAQLMEWFSHYQVLAFVATHDLELPEILQGICDNIHFSEQVSKDNGVTFDYQLKQGVSHSKNAIRLLETLGYPEEIVEGAQSAAEEFEKTRIWKRWRKKENKPCKNSNFSAQ